MDTPMMRCGHAANATADGKPVCVVCLGLTPDAEIVNDSPPLLDGRMAECVYTDCRHMAPSSPNLPLFEHRPRMRMDLYYCGCKGWD